MIDATPASVPSAAAERLDRLEFFLREDPSHNALRVDAFETALLCGRWDRALVHLERAQSSRIDSLSWHLRESDFWMAQGHHAQARDVLGKLAEAPAPNAAFAAAVVYRQALVDLRLGRTNDSARRLAPLVESTSAPIGSHAASPVASRALQQLWLRALHQDGQLARAIGWAREAEDHGRLDPQAAGVASLTAVDASDFATAQRWSALSLGDGVESEHPVEVLVTLASLALAARNVPLATKYAQAAVAREPDDGRAWSTCGFAALLAGDLEAARSAFVRALAALPAHIGTWHGLAWTEILAGRLDDAQISFSTALELDVGLAETHGGLAVVLALLQSREDAEAHAAQALRLDRRNISGRFATALLGGQVEDAQDIQRLARRLLGGRGAPLDVDLPEALRRAVG